MICTRSFVHSGMYNILHFYVFRSVMSKPREFAHLIRNKFGSADNINSLSSEYIFVVDYFILSI